jgi:hypothetical protein
MEREVVDVKRIDTAALARAVEAIYRGELERERWEERGPSGRQSDPFQTDTVGLETAFTRSAASSWPSLVSWATSALRSRLNSRGGAVASSARTSSKVGMVSRLRYLRLG